MSRWRIVVVLVLVAVPFLVLAGAGSYWLWISGRGLLVWWPMMALAALGYILGAYWQRKQMLLRPVDMTPPAHSTERDKRAWQLIEARAKAASRLDSDKLSNPQHYLDVAQEMGRELAVHYHPNTEDLTGSLTVPEILAVVELAAHDVAEMVDRYLPGGHLLTIRDWQRAKTAADWYQRASNVFWAISAVLSPISTATRYTASRVGLSTPLKMLQQNLILWFYTAFLQRLGTYLIGLYSGRLRVGARRWRELVLGEKHPKPAIIAVMTHIDLLSPAMEWAPPYDWQHPKRPKEKSIHDALAAVAEQLGEHVAAVVPVCGAPGKVFGLEEALLPAITARLDEAHAVSLLRCLQAESDTRKVRKVFDQFLAVGKTIVRAVWQDLQGKPGR